jgi:hypothetical protein
MARKQEKQARGLGRLRSAADAVKRLFVRGRKSSENGQSTRSAAAPEPRASQSGSQAGRVTRRPTDIPLDMLDGAYTPSATSSKAGFRSDGADHQRDQELATGVADDRWNDEDRLTNKSGDPRIGTHRRTYEPGETRPESRN